MEFESSDWHQLFLRAAMAITSGFVIGIHRRITVGDSEQVYVLFTFIGALIVMVPLQISGADPGSVINAASRIIQGFGSILVGFGIPFLAPNSKAINERIGSFVGVFICLNLGAICGAGLVREWIVVTIGTAVIFLGGTIVDFISWLIENRF
jgi:hypothetical protein